MNIKSNTIATYIKSKTFREDLFKIVAVAFIYFLAHQLAFFFPDSQKIIMLIWPAGGVGLAAFLLYPRRLWPAMTVAFFISGVVADIFLAERSFMSSAGYMTANIVESILCAQLIFYVSNDFKRFNLVKEIIALIF